MWLLNGVIFYVLLFATGPVAARRAHQLGGVPHALSVPVQYLSLDWPTENGWVAYNALQLVAVLRHRLRGRAACPHYRSRHVTGAVDALSASQQDFQHIDSRPLHFLVLVW